RTAVVDGDRVKLSDEQARAILALTLSRLTGLGRDEIFDEARTLADAIAGYLEILASRDKVVEIIRDELNAVREAFAVPRRCQIVDGGAELEDEDLIVREEMVVTVTHGGYVKRTPLATYRTQKRGGKGRSGMATKDEDAVVRVFVASTHAPILFFSSEGKVYTLKVWRLPIGLPNSRGKAFVNLLPLEQGETITSILTAPEDEAAWDRQDLMFATQSGNVRRNKLSDFQRINRAGKIAMKLDEGDHIVGVSICNADNDVLLTTALGRCIRFGVEEVRVFAGRESDGVRGVRLGEDDRVMSMAILRQVGSTPEERRAYMKLAAAQRRATGEAVDDAGAPADDEDAAEGAETSLSTERFAELGAAEEFILTADSEGFGKRTSAFEYRRTGRGGQGLIAHDMARGGHIVAAFPVEHGDQLMMVSDQGQIIRAPVDEIRIAGRNTRGVILFRTAEGEHVVSVERLEGDGEDGDVAVDAEDNSAEDNSPEDGAGEA
ncbi:MAG: gyrA, partial [Caulobacteraceae bacterium]|nr:gyrA [Caulobacteraceae bacterium]